MAEGGLKQNRKKLLAPIIIVAILVLYYIAFVVACFIVNGFPLFIKMIAGTIPLILAGICVYVLLERIKEIKSGEEDDLSQY